MKGPVIHLVDDDPWVRIALRRILRLRGHQVWEHESAEAFLADPSAERAACVILDLRMSGWSGLELQAELERRGVGVPIIFLTAHGDVGSSVTAMKQGAVDFLQKPVREQELFDAVDRAMAAAVTVEDRRAARAQATERIALLTPREHEVMAFVVAGRRNRQIADLLGITEQTVKVHRMRAMAKLELEMVPDLIRMWELAEEATPAAGAIANGLQGNGQGGNSRSGEHHANARQPAPGPSGGRVAPQTANRDASRASPGAR